MSKSNGKAHLVEIRYPHSWAASPSPGLARQLDDAAMTWLGRCGLLDKPENRRNAAACDLGQAVARSNPTAASTERLEFYAKFLGMWFLYEDNTEGIGLKSQIPSLVSRAVTGFWEGPLPEGGPLRYWAELGYEMKQNMSPQWRQRFGTRYEAWQHSVSDEASLVRAYGTAADLDAYLTVRLHTLGMYTATDMIEYTQGRELPPEVFADPDVMEIYRIISTACLIDNDLYGITKDRTATFPNLVGVTARDRGLTETQTCQRLIEWHDRLIDRFILVENRLRGDRAALCIDWWLDCVHHLMTGLGDWHHNAPRYQSEHLTGEGDLLHLKIVLTPSLSSNDSPVLIAGRALPRRSDDTCRTGRARTVGSADSKVPSVRPGHGR